MEKLKAIAVILAIVTQIGLLIDPPLVSAATMNCGSSFQIIVENPAIIENLNTTIPIVLQGPFNDQFEYAVSIGLGYYGMPQKPVNNTINIDYKPNDYFNRQIGIVRVNEDGTYDTICTAGEFVVDKGDPVYNTCSIDISPNPPILGKSVSVTVTGLEPDAEHNIKFDYIGGGNAGNPSVTADRSGQASASFTPDRAGDARIIVSKSQGGSNELCRTQFKIAESEEEAELIAGDSQYLRKLTVNICTHIPDADKRAKCEQCSDGVWTGLGCFNTSPGAPISNFIKQLFSVAIGLGGGFSFLLLIYGAFMLTTSAGDPKAVENARGIITGALTGLLIIIFSAVILQIVGVGILQIPEF